MFGFLNKSDAKVINVSDIDDLVGKVELINIRGNCKYAEGSIKTLKIFQWVNF